VRGGAVRKTVREESVVLAPGDVCVVFTDGYTEAFRENGEDLFGIERFRATVAGTAPRGGAIVLDALRDAVRAWTGSAPPSDDETVVVISSPAPAARATVSESMELDLASAWLTRAEAAGAPLELPTRVEELAAMDPWFERLSSLARLPEGARELVRSALYETLANIAEHGDQDRGRARMRIWWLPAGASEPNVLGRFVVLDEAAPFHPPAASRPLDFNDASVRLRGRGIGTEIMRRALAGIVHFPGTPRGNVTLLTVGRQETPPEALEEAS
jgi:hypothetical protein